MAYALAWSAIFFAVAVVTGHWVAGFATGTGAVALALLVQAKGGASAVVQRIRHSNLLDERPVLEERQARDTGLRE